MSADPQNDFRPGDMENVILRKILARLEFVSSGGGGGGGGTLSTDGTFAANSDALYPSQKAAKTYIDNGLAGKQNSLGFTPENVANKSNDTTLAADSATLYPTQHAVKSYVTTQVGAYVLKAGDTMTGALLLPDGAVGAPSLSHAADTNTGLWYPAADTIAFSTAGTERVRINSTGKVGIGISPTANLDVFSSGLTYIALTGNAFPLIQITDQQAGGEVWNVENGRQVGSFGIFGSATGQVLTILKTSGNVGLGTSIPNEILSINGPRAALYNTLTSSTNFERLDFEWSANVCRIWTEKGSGGGTARDLVLGTDATENMRLQVGQNVDITAQDGTGISLHSTGNPQFTLTRNGTQRLKISAQSHVGTISGNGGLNFGGATDVVHLTLDANGNLGMITAKTLSIASGANQRAGNATLVGGTVTVANTTVTANTVVMLTRKTSGGTIGTAITYTVSAATSFTINSDSVIDTSTFSYFLIEVP